VRLSIAVCLVVVWGGVAWAEDHFSERGQGIVPCAKFGEWYRTDPNNTEDTFFAWALGYISGINAASAKAYADLKAKEPDEMKHYLRQYCDAHPLASYSDGVLELMKSLPAIER
jgi:hypothetical protein